MRGGGVLAIAGAGLLGCAPAPGPETGGTAPSAPASPEAKLDCVALLEVSAERAEPGEAERYRQGAERLFAEAAAAQGLGRAESRAVLAYARDPSLGVPQSADILRVFALLQSLDEAEREHREAVAAGRDLSAERRACAAAAGDV